MVRSVFLSVVSYPQLDGRVFEYSINSSLKPPHGSLVNVRFGSKSTLGVVVAQPKAEPGRANDSPHYELHEIDSVLELPPLPRHVLELANWMMDYYAASPSSVWRTLLPSGLLQKSRLKPNIPHQGSQPTTNVQLTPEQIIALNTIKKGDYLGYLLHGITGSGKTEVYIELIRNCLLSGKSALLLIPEIALTPQTEERLSKHFGDQLVTTHSKLTPARRKQIWVDALTSQTPRIYVGPRSALFLPIHNLGCIVVDEEHESSYKQENNPTYQTNTVVAKLAQLTGARYVLGSATPAIYTYHAAQTGRIGYLPLTTRATGAQLPTVTRVQPQTGELLSQPLLQALQTTLQAGNQAILFLNRRGSAQAMLCETCGSIRVCPRCDTSLTFHADLGRLICHFCNYRELPPSLCPNCQSSNQHFIGSGTKKIEALLYEQFRDYEIRRLDSDNATLDYLNSLYEELKNRTADLVIGTQMIARGLDLPHVTLVGVVAAESSLMIPDYSSSEHTFQLLTQVAGRAGRSQKPGNVIFQTLSPEHPAIVYAATHDYKAYYQWELEHRNTHAYPPFVYLLKLTYSSRDQLKAQAAANQLVTVLGKTAGIVVLGPITKTSRRTPGHHQQQVIIKSCNRGQLVDIARSLGHGWKHDLDPINLL